MVREGRGMVKEEGGGQRRSDGKREGGRERQSEGGRRTGEREKGKEGVWEEGMGWFSSNHQRLEAREHSS